MPLIVQKYGGSSLATPRHILRAAKRIKMVKESGRDVVVVASAMGRMTDHLITLAKRTVKSPPQRELDMLMTAGERISMSLLAMALHEEGVPAISFTGSQSGILTTSDHTEAKILDIRAHRIRDELGKGRVVIIAGFQGVSQEKEITTLGRGGSDTSAVALAAALGAETCEILTDVDGLFSADPRRVPNARLLHYCSYDEALELSSLGAKMQARSIVVAKRYQVKVRIASSSHNECAGTELTAQAPREEGTMESTMIRGIATRDGYTFFRCKLSLQKLAPALEAKRVSLRFFTHGADDTNFLVEKEKVEIVRQLLAELSVSATEVSKVTIVSAVGDGIEGSPTLIPTVLRALESAGAECLLMSANAHSLTAAISSRHAELVAQRLHAELIEK